MKLGVDFSEVERAHVSERFYPGFSWRSFDEFSPVNPMTVALADARVAVVTTAGIHLSSDEPFKSRSDSGDSSFRAFGSNCGFSELSLTHGGYDTKRASTDMNVVLPLDHLRNAAVLGEIRGITPTVYSFMGYIPDTNELLEVTAPEVARLLAAEQPDLVMLVPT